MRSPTGWGRRPPGTWSRPEVGATEPKTFHFQTEKDEIQFYLNCYQIANMKQFHFQTKINVYYGNFDILSVSAFVQALLNSRREKIFHFKKVFK